MSAVFEGFLPGIPDSIVRENRELASEIPGTSPIGPFTAAGPGVLWFEVPRVARYLVRGGKTVEYAAESGADPAAVELFLHTSARGALIHQRREIPLNATTLIAPNMRTVALCGPSPVGKSTLAAALCLRGWLLVAEDITRIVWNGSAPVVWPSHRTVKLWRDACEMLGSDAGKLSRVRDGLEKFYVPVRAAVTPSALGIIIRLRAAPGNEVVEIPPANRAGAISESTFRPLWIDPLGCRVHHSRAAGEVGRSCRAVVLSGARERPVHDLADHVAELVQ
jgi:hypothetical protein